MNTRGRIRILWAGSIACFFAFFSLISHGSHGNAVASSVEEAKSRPIWNCSGGGRQTGDKYDMLYGQVYDECMRAMANATAQRFLTSYFTLSGSCSNLALRTFECGTQVPSPPLYDPHTGIVYHGTWHHCVGIMSTFL